MTTCSCGKPTGTAWLGLRMLVAFVIITAAWSSCARADTPPPKILAVADAQDSNSKSVGLNDYLAVKLDGTGLLVPDNYVLYLNRRPVDDLADVSFDAPNHAVVFHLQRTPKNADAWTGVLGSARGLTVPVTVTLGVRAGANAPVGTVLTGDGTAAEFRMAISSTGQLIGAAVVILLMLAVVWGRARYTTLLKDNLLPQLAPMRQPYSLGRWQMAFWFTLVFISFVVLYVTLWDYHTVTTQALVLMGLSGTTGILAIAVDIAKNTPVDDANNALRALGLNSYADVVQLRQQIDKDKKTLAANPPPANATPLQIKVATQLQTKIDDAELLLETYEQRVKPFETDGWYRDLTTDINGPALHRVQVFCWTWVLGGVFIIGAWQTLAMPAFDDTLLALMGLSSAGYIGFKYPEQQN
jgi:hypothetical protein